MTGKPPDIDLPPPPVPPPQESPSLRTKSKKCQMLKVFECQMFGQGGIEAVKQHRLLEKTPV